jgi:O-acetyl-ADP-ribose deacetylase (regulator of RNase III)
VPVGGTGEMDGKGEDCVAQADKSKAMARQREKIFRFTEKKYTANRTNRKKLKISRYNEFMNLVIQTLTFPAGQKLELVHGDLTEEHVDAIVNAANRYLAHGGGVAAAILRKGGPVIRQESEAWVRTHGPVSHETPAYTQAGALPCRYVIHAVGPMWGGGDEDRKLSAAVTGSLALAEQLGLTSLAIPPISTGIFGFPKERAARIFKSAITAYYVAHPQSKLDPVRLTIIDQETLLIFETVWKQ